MIRKNRTYIATPPGETLREQLEDRGISQKELARRTGLSEKHVSHLVNGDVMLTARTALLLEAALGIPAGFWLRLEATYREKLARIELVESPLPVLSELANA